MSNRGLKIVLHLSSDVGTRVMNIDYVRVDDPMTRVLVAPEIESILPATTQDYILYAASDGWWWGNFGFEISLTPIGGDRPINLKCQYQALGDGTRAWFDMTPDNQWLISQQSPFVFLWQARMVQDMTAIFDVTIAPRALHFG